MLALVSQTLPKFFALRVSPPAHPVPALVPKCPKIAPTWPQHGAKISPKTSKIEPRWGPKMGYPIGPVGEKIERKHQRNKEEGGSSQGPPQEPKKWPTWPQLGPQNGAKMAKKSMQKCIIFLMPLGIDFWVEFGRFWVPKSSQVDT